MVIKFSFVYLLLLFSTLRAVRFLSCIAFSVYEVVCIPQRLLGSWVVGYKLPLVPNYNFNQV